MWKATRRSQSEGTDYHQKELEEGKPVWTGEYVVVYSPSAVHGENLGVVLQNFLKEAEPNGYVAINAYLPRNEEMIKALQALRVAIRSKTGNAVTAGFGPRFQHSTGQFHKGGPKNALLIVITAEPAADFDIPTEGLTFGTLIRAQALGDYEALIEAGRKVLRVHLPGTQDVKLLAESRLIRLSQAGLRLWAERIWIRFDIRACDGDTGIRSQSSCQNHEQSWKKAAFVQNRSLLKKSPALNRNRQHSIIKLQFPW
jgi:hypothetical protein